MKQLRRQIRHLLLRENKAEHLEKLLALIRTGDPANISQAAELGAAIDVDLYTAIYNDPEVKAAMLESLVPDGDQDEMVFELQTEILKITEKIVKQYTGDAWEWWTGFSDDETWPIAENLQEIVLAAILSAVCEHKFRGHWND